MNTIYGVSLRLDILVVYILFNSQSNYYMLFFDRLRNIKIALAVVAIFIAIGSLVTSNHLVAELQREESNNMEVWAEAMRSLNTADSNTDLNLVLKVINGNNTIPVIVLDKDGNVQTFRNIDVKGCEDSLAVIRNMAERMMHDGNSIRIYLDMPEQQTDTFDDGAEENVSTDGDTNRYTVEQTVRNPDTGDYMEICYDESLMLKRLSYFPYIQLCVMLLFVGIALFALFVSMRSEQNKVWVGLSKETAHQLGTPISSLMAWTEVLKESYPDDVLLPEMEKDVKRLELIADRFSKIGSLPELKPGNLCELIGRVAEYMDRRTSSKVKIGVSLPNEPVVVNMMSSLFEWVIENLCKNAVDAMDGHGTIDISVGVSAKIVFIEVKDNGKGIPKSHFKTVFSPGFTTKKRGWGLGLSLARRIVEDYHRGRIFVKSSELGKGTTFRIEIPK